MIGYRVFKREIEVRPGTDLPDIKNPEDTEEIFKALYLALVDVAHGIVYEGDPPIQIIYNDIGKGDHFGFIVEAMFVPDLIGGIHWEVRIRTKMSKNDDGG